MEPTLHSFGGSALDRHMFDFESVADTSAATAGDQAGDTTSSGTDAAASATDGGAAAAAGETESSAVATGDTPAWTPEQITALREDPTFQSWMADEAASIADVRFQTLLEQARATGIGQQTDGDQGANVDLNQLLDPYSDNFGTNLVAVLNTLFQNVNQNLDERFQPFQEQARETQQAELDTVLGSAITDHAATLGGLRGGEDAVRRVAASVRSTFMPEAARIYGNTDRAAQVAIDRAVRAERQYQEAVSTGAGQAQIEHLAELAGTRGEVAAAGANGVVTLPDKPLSSRERVMKYGRLHEAAR